MIRIPYIFKIHFTSNTTSNSRIGSTDFKTSNDFNSVWIYFIYL